MGIIAGGTQVLVRFLIRFPVIQDRRVLGQQYIFLILEGKYENK